LFGRIYYLPGDESKALPVLTACECLSGWLLARMWRAMTGHLIGSLAAPII